MSDELEVRVAKALFRFEQCDREQAKDVDGGWVGRLDNQDRAEYLGMAREAIHEVHVDAAQAVAIEREATLVYLGNLLLALDRLNIANPGHGYDREAFRLSIYIDGIRSAEHVKP